MGKAHQCTKVREPYKKMASNRAAPSDPRAAAPMSQETDVRIQHDPKPWLPVPGCMQGLMGGGGVLRVLWQMRGRPRVKWG